MKLAVAVCVIAGHCIGKKLEDIANLEFEEIKPILSDNFSPPDVYHEFQINNTKCTGRKSDRKRNRANRWR